MSTLHHILQTTFGFPAFRASQQDVCQAAVDGRDVLLVMPTGAGKSLCYQLPALARKGTALVISPLIALMDDQANKLTSLGLSVGRIHSGLDRDASRGVCRDFLDGKLQFLFIAPERFRVPGFAQMLTKQPLSLIAIDEAHCISQWGHDFRPDYRNLAAHLIALRPAPIIALTATATPQVQRDIVSELGLRKPAEFIQGFRRTNLAVEAVEVSKPRRIDLARKLLADAANRPAILYAPSRKDAEAFAAELKQDFTAAAYHAGLDAGTRERVQRAFLTGKLEVVVATVAFGMGIDKADVRTVLHMAMPASVESFYQEIGRAGRDGLPARSVLMHSYQDRRMHDFFLERDYPPADTLTRIAAQLGAEPIYADDLRLRLKLDLNTFGPALDKLLSQGAAQVDFSGNVIATDRTKATAWQGSYQAQVNFRRAQIDSMMRFATGAECRMAALIRHFGDMSDAARSCGICDFCSPERATAQSFRGPTRDELDEMKRILRAVSAAAGKSTGKLYTELYPREQLDRKEMDSLLDALVRAGYMTIESATFTAEGRDIAYRRATLTHEGHEAAEGEPLAHLQMRDTEASNAGRTRSKAANKAGGKQAKKVDDTPLTEEQKPLEAALRAWRRGVADELKKPAFVIFSDSTLRGIVMDRPTTLRDLVGVSGMGQGKVDRWGESICAVVRGESVPVAPLRPVLIKGNTRPSAAQSQIPAAKPETLELALKVWRMNEAKRQQMAPFSLLADSLVVEIAGRRPANVSALLAVPGVKSSWVTEYGASICSVIAQHPSTR